MVQVHVVSVARFRLRRWTIRGLSKAHLTVYRVTGGRVLGSVAGMPVLLLTTTGRRSGKARTTPLTFFRDGADLVVIASNGGADRPPDWSLNLQQIPRAVVRIGTDKLVVTARPASEQDARAAVGRGHGHVRRLCPLPRTDDAPDTGGASLTRGQRWLAIVKGRCSLPVLPRRSVASTSMRYGPSVSSVVLQVWAR